MWTAAPQVNVGVVRQPPSIYAEAVKLHEIIDNDKLFSERIGTTRLYDALADWFLNGTRYTVTAARASCIPIHVYEHLCRTPSRAGQGCHRGQWRAWHVDIMAAKPQVS